MGSADETGKKKKQLGGLRTLPFILSNEVSDRFATAGFNSNMIEYLRNELHFPLVKASNTVSNFAGIASTTPIVGALIADSFAGRFWTIIFGSLVYLLGMVGVTISATVPALRPPQCPSQSALCAKASGWQEAVFYSTFLLTTIGTGGIRPCISGFGAEQLEPRQGSNRKCNFFNLFFICIGMSQMLGFTLVVYVQDNVEWGLGFGIPALAMLLSALIFAAGYPFYIRKKPAGSPLARLAQVVVASFRKWRLQLPPDPTLLYHNAELDADISTVGHLSHTHQFRCLDRAAIISDYDVNPATGLPHRWRLSTVHRVEELKSIVRILPIWSFGIILYTVASNNSNFGIAQAKTMDRRLSPSGSFKLPPASISIFSASASILTIAFYDRLLARALPRLTHLRRVGVGLFLSVPANIAAALVESRRRRSAATGRQLSVYWLVPQYAAHGVAEGFASVGLMEFLYDQSPESMRSVAGAFYWLAISAGHYCATLLVTVVNHLSHGRWLQDNINEGRLDWFYWLGTCLQILNFGYYLVCSRLYVFKKLEEASGVENVEPNINECSS